MKLQTLKRTARTIAELSNGELTAGEVEQVLNRKWKYCTGKYETSGRNAEIKEPPPYPIYYETRSDKDGNYLTLFCVLDDRLKAAEERTNQKINKIWKQATQ